MHIIEVITPVQTTNVEMAALTLLLLLWALHQPHQEAKPRMTELHLTRNCTSKMIKKSIWNMDSHPLSWMMNLTLSARCSMRQELRLHEVTTTSRCSNPKHTDFAIKPPSFFQQCFKSCNTQPRTSQNVTKLNNSSLFAGFLLKRRNQKATYPWWNPCPSMTCSSHIKPEMVVSIQKT